MPFDERTRVDLREAMVLDVVNKGYSISEAARKYGVERPTVRLWVRRYESEGRLGLTDRSHAPLRCPHKTAPEIEQLIIAEKLETGYGAKKIRQRLMEVYPEIVFPSRAAFDQILSRNGLVRPRRARRRQAASPFIHRYTAKYPGELYTMDFKGQFRLGNRKYCYPLTIADNVSRYLLTCHGLANVELEPTWRIVERTLRQYGLPTAMQSDNGPPFGAANGQFSTMSVRLMQLDVQPIFSRPGCPQDNGRHERQHRDLKAETTRPPEANGRAQQRRFDEYRRQFNHERPHEGIEMQRPARIFTGGVRPYPSRITKPDYPGHFDARLVCSSGHIKWKNLSIFISYAFAGQTIALEPTDDGIWTIHFGRFRIGRINERDQSFT